MAGVLDSRIDETPIAIIDFETTGLTPGYDRVLEVSVVRKDPGEAPRLVFDTLVNPRRRVAATEIHGITDHDVSGAPYFEDVAGDFLNAISDCVITAYNVYFDIKFFTYEFSQAGASLDPPHFCLMYLRPMLELGTRCRLEEACRDASIDYEQLHIAGSDAQASGRLLDLYLTAIRVKRISTFGDLARLRSYKFIKSFANDPPRKGGYNLSGSGRLKSRFQVTPAAPPSPAPVDPTIKSMRVYWDALRAVVADLQITDEESNEIAALRASLNLPLEQVRVLHARAFSSAVAQFMDDLSIDERETRKLRLLKNALSKLGWAPGD